MSFDGQTTLKEMLEDMSLDELFKVIDIIRARPDVNSVLVTTEKEVKEAEEFYRRQYEKTIGGVPDEST